MLLLAPLNADAEKEASRCATMACLAYIPNHCLKLTLEYMRGKLLMAAQILKLPKVSRMILGQQCHTCFERGRDLYILDLAPVPHTCSRAQS